MLPFKIKTEKPLFFFHNFQNKKLHLAPIPSELNGEEYLKIVQFESGPVLKLSHFKVVQFESGPVSKAPCFKMIQIENDPVFKMAEFEGGPDCSVLKSSSIGPDRLVVMS